MRNEWIVARRAREACTLYESSPFAWCARGRYDLEVWC